MNKKFLLFKFYFEETKNKQTNKQKKTININHNYLK